MPSKKQRTPDAIPNNLIHKNDTGCIRIGVKTSLKTVTMLTKILFVYISLMVPDRPMVTIIDR